MQNKQHNLFKRFSKQLQLVGVVLSAVLLGSCSSLKYDVVNIPTHFSDVVVEPNIQYGELAEQKLDIYRPSHSNALDPVVVFYYGGRWEQGAKEDYRFVGNALAQKGFVVVIPDYRKFPNVQFPVFVQDGTKALVWVADNISAHHGNADFINISGHSAGAHIGSLIATDPRYLAAYGKNRSIIRSFVGLAGPYAFTPDAEDLKAMFGPSANYPQMQATTFIDGRQPPMLLLWGEKDTSVKRINLDRMAEAIHTRGGCVVTKTYPDMDHAKIIASLSWLGNQTVLQDMVEFFYNHRCNTIAP